MNPVNAMFESDIPNLPLLGRGKVRDIYSIDKDHLLIVTTDRLSAYDVVLPDPVPGKGEILTKLSNFWFAMMEDIMPNHLTNLTLQSVVRDSALRALLADRSTIVRKLEPLPIEAVVRGYLIGSGWLDYQASGEVCGIALPGGLEQAAKLSDPLFTPATKARAGDHDENISLESVRRMIGDDLAETVRDLSIQIYSRAAAYARQRGIIIADTKFEFGRDAAGNIYLIDEVLTPDSSRFWPLSEYRTGISPPSFDKQYVRDYLDTLDWDRAAPGPALPQEVLLRSARKYREALEILTA